jgi:hypothetical protein
MKRFGGDPPCPSGIFPSTTPSTLCSISAATAAGYRVSCRPARAQTGFTWAEAADRPTPQNIRPM